ncbi:MAG: branched-chain amino acid ABC transporter ATP-binding protein/permease [Rhodospirillaceae bacterium]|nr:branched-chain amino acid ABC transporter ATP-binding protein/permease [Rhodospirillaceae bacterium]
MSGRPILAAVGPAPLWLLAGGAVAIYAAAANSYQLRLIAIAGCYALAVLGYQFVFGRLGALSLAQGAFFGLGAYASGLLALKLGWDFARSFPAAILLAVVVAAIVGASVLRLASHYFALATLAVAELLRILVVEWVSLTGGGNGLPSVPAIAAFGWSPAPGWQTTAFVWAWVGLGAYLAAAYAASLYGDGSRLLRADPLAAAAVGIDGARRRMAAFLLSAGFGAAGGALWVHTLGVVSPDAMQFDIMVLLLCMTVIGGRNAVPGAILGALLLVHLPEWLRAFERWALFAYGAGLLAAIVLAPEGIAGAVEGVWRRWAGPRPLPRPALRPPLRKNAAPPSAAAGSPDDRAVLATQGVGIAFGGNLALAGVTMFLRRGEILGLIGPNGSGKSTLLNLLSGFYPPDAGRVLFDGQDVGRLPAWRRARAGVARSFQHAALADDLTALDNVAVAAQRAGTARLADMLRLPGRDRRRARARALAYAALDGVAAVRSAGKLGRDLTTAERRRVELARAIVAEPKAILLDEPAAGLSDAEKLALRTSLRELAARGIGILIVDHGMPFLLSLAHRVICLDAGRIVAAGTPAEVAAHPDVRRAYLGKGAAP